MRLLSSGRLGFRLIQEEGSGTEGGPPHGSRWGRVAGGELARVNFPVGLRWPRNFMIQVFSTKSYVAFCGGLRSTCHLFTC